MEAFGAYNRQRRFNALEGNWNLAGPNGSFWESQ